MSTYSPTAAAANPMSLVTNWFVKVPFERIYDVNKGSEYAKLHVSTLKAHVELMHHEYVERNPRDEQLVAPSLRKILQFLSRSDVDYYFFKRHYELWDDKGVRRDFVSIDSDSDVESEDLLPRTHSPFAPFVIGSGPPPSSPVRPVPRKRKPAVAPPAPIAREKRERNPPARFADYAM